MPKSNEYTCPTCRTRWIGVNQCCPNGCTTLAKSDGEFTHKTFQGNDTDLIKGGR